jgi:hypothetical protein
MALTLLLISLCLPLAPLLWQAAWIILRDRAEQSKRGA